MKVLYSNEEFYARTKIIRDHLDLDIEPDTRSGIFRRTRLNELMQYCSENPQYHIISVLFKSFTKVNHPVPEAACYLLGEGDPDPELMFIISMTQNQFERSKLYKFEID